MRKSDPKEQTEEMVFLALTFGGSGDGGGGD